MRNNPPLAWPDGNARAAGTRPWRCRVARDESSRAVDPEPPTLDPPGDTRRPERRRGEAATSMVRTRASGGGNGGGLRRIAGSGNLPAAGPRPRPPLRVLPRAPPLPGLGELVRRPERRVDLVARSQGGQKVRRPGRAGNRCGRHRVGRRNCPLRRRRAVCAVPSLERGRSRASLEQRGGIALDGGPPPAGRRSGPGPVGRRQPFDGGCPGDRPGGFGQDQGPDGAPPPPDRRARGGAHHGDRAGLQPARGRRADRAIEQPGDTTSSPYPNAQQPGPVDLRHLWWPGATARPRGAHGP